MTFWQPTASATAIHLRAEILKHIREFFDHKQVLEVDTPILSSATSTDPFIESFTTQYHPLLQSTGVEDYFLHTSPELPMKRLVSAGLGSIYQITKVFRQGELGKRHNPEFTLLEWYREGFNHHQLMHEVDTLLRELLQPCCSLAETQFMTYQQAFELHLNINPHTVTKEHLIHCCKERALDNVLAEDEDKDRFLELLFSHIIQPRLGKAEDPSHFSISFIYNYPASQASLSRINLQDGCRIAERFEVFVNGVEIANGFNELRDADEQRRRFHKDNQLRQRAGKSLIPVDERFLAALPQLPACAGVALGIERLLMIMLHTEDIRDVVNFPFDIA